MSHTIAPKHQKIVLQEILRWQTEGLIEDTLASKLTPRYSDNAAPPNISGALTLIGSVLVGLGAILLVGSNWQQIGVVIKVSLIVLATFTAHLLAWRFQFEPGNRPKLGSALFVLGSLFYGAGIWLIAQIFNIDMSVSNGLIIWAVGALASALATKNVSVGCLTALLLSAWTFSMSEWVFAEGKQLIALLNIFISLSVLIPLANIVRSRAIAWISLTSAGVYLGIWAGSNQAVLLWGLACLAGYLWCKVRRPLLASPFLYVGSISLLGSLLSQTTDLPAWISAQSLVKLGTMSFITLSTLMIVIWKVEKYRSEAIIAIMLAVAGCLSYGYADGAGRILSNVLLLSTIAGLVYTGLHRVQSAGLVNVAFVFFVLDVIARYFDFFYTMMNRSIFFVSAGIVLIIVGSMVENGRRRMLAGLTRSQGDLKFQGG